jgi:putative phage-type endonuclease
MKVIDLRQRSPQWHAWRKQGVSATSAAVVLKENPDKTPWRLWCELTGKVQPQDISMIPQVRIAIMLESHAMAWFEERYGVITLPLCAESSEHPVIRASFDGLMDDLSPVEAKILSDNNFRDVSEMMEESFHYKLYFWQVQHQIYVSGGVRGYLLFYHTRNEPIVFEILRDDKAIEKMVAAELSFWSQVVADKEPAKDKMRDFFVPEGDLMEKWVTAAIEYRTFESKKLEAKAEFDRLAGLQSDIQKSLLGLMGDNMLADCEGVKITRYMQSGRVAWKDIVMQLDPSFNEAKYPKFCGAAKSERVKVTIDDMTPISAATLEYGLGVVDPRLGYDFCA